MARVRSRDTRPEMLLRRALWASGRRYRIGVKLPGTPDLAFIGPRLAVFVDGCFWHGCPDHYTAPTENDSFWRAKLERNVSRDRRVDHELAELGWRVLRFWEHEVTRDLPRVVEMLSRALDTTREIQLQRRHAADSGPHQG